MWRQSEEGGNQMHRCEILASRIISELLFKKAPSKQVCTKLDFYLTEVFVTVNLTTRPLKQDVVCASLFLPGGAEEVVLH